jgi:hypothetical protein
VGEEDRAASQNERLKGSSNVSFTKAHIGNSGDSRVSMRSDLE